MILAPRPGGPRVVLVTPGIALDSDGDPVESWAPEDVTRTPLPGAQVQDRNSTETTGDGQTRVVSTRVLFAPGRPPLTAGCRVEVDGVPFLVDGDALYRRSFAAQGFTTVTLTRATG